MNQRLLELVKAAQKEMQQNLNWLNKWQPQISGLPGLDDKKWRETRLIQKLPLPRVPEHSKISSLDGGIVTEELRGFDIVVCRALVSTFFGIGTNVKVEYYPNFDPETETMITKSFGTRQKFATFATLARLYQEYSVAVKAIHAHNPDVLFIDGSIFPLLSDIKLSSSEWELKRKLQDVFDVHRELLEISFKKKTVLVGVIKDSRSRQFVKSLQRCLTTWMKLDEIDKSVHKGYGAIFNNMLDTELASVILDEGERTAWHVLNSPSYHELELEFRMTLARPLAEDDAIRLEVIYQRNSWLDSKLNLALQSFYLLCQHGLPVSLPSVLLETDKRVKLGKKHIEDVINNISIEFGIPIAKLKKRRSFASVLNEI